MNTIISIVFRIESACRNSVQFGFQRTLIGGHFAKCQYWVAIVLIIDILCKVPAAKRVYSFIAFEPRLILCRSCIISLTCIQIITVGIGSPANHTTDRFRRCTRCIQGSFCYITIFDASFQITYNTSNMALIVGLGNCISNTITVSNIATLIIPAYCSAFARRGCICCHQAISNIAVQDSTAIVITYQNCCIRIVDFFCRCHCNAGVFDAKIFDCPGCAQFRKESLLGYSCASNV